MFCTNCRHISDDACNFCANCGNDPRHSSRPAAALKSGASTMLQSPYEEARQLIQLGAILCYLLAALHLYELYVATNGAFRFGAAIGSPVFAAVAWRLWRSNSFAAGVAAFAALCLESLGLLAVTATRIAAPESRQSGAMTSGYMIMLAIGVFAAGCSTLRATIRVRRIVAHSASC
jgi:hypothetical protein